MTDHDDELLEASEAVKYLANRWGIESYSMDAFKQLRLRRRLKPALSGARATFWRKSDLDKIEKPDLRRPRPSARKPRPRKKQDGDEPDRDLRTVILMGNSHQHHSSHTHHIPQLVTVVGV